MKFQNVNGRRYYEQEEKDWLIENYPKLGVKETTRQFNELFNHNKNEIAIKRYCAYRLGLRVSREVTIALKSAPIGYKYRDCRGVWKIKTEDGWIPLAHLYQNVPKGYIAFHLDGNQDNNEPDNIIVIPNGLQTTARNYDMVSENPIITKTALTWCELYKLLKDYNKRLVLEEDLD